MERKAIFRGNLHLFNNFKIMCCAICHYKINLSNNIFRTVFIVCSIRQDIQCGLHKLCKGTSRFCFRLLQRLEEFLNFH